MAVNTLEQMWKDQPGASSHAGNEEFAAQELRIDQLHW
jgi:hypothetical protein